MAENQEEIRENPPPTALERVTNVPQEQPANPQQNVKKEKDPKKVAAGRAAAAAKKAKREQLLEELRVTKESLRSGTSHARTDQQNTDDTARRPPSRQPRLDAEESRKINWSAAILGAVGLVGVYLFLHGVRQQPLLALAKQQQKPHAVPPSKLDHLELKDPFHME